MKRLFRLVKRLVLTARCVFLMAEIDGRLAGYAHLHDAAERALSARDIEALRAKLAQALADYRATFPVGTRLTWSRA